MNIALPFDLLHLIKECQLQHGLRTGDFDRYHKYLTNRLATVRKQLNFKHREGPGRKGQVSKYQSKEITPQALLATISSPATVTASEALSAFSLTATTASKAASTTSANSSNVGGGRYLELLALYAERCWSVYEAEVHRASKKEGSDAISSPKAATDDSGLVDARKKLNKASKWAEQLFVVASSVFNPSSATGKDTYYEATAACIVHTCEGYLHETKGRCAAAHRESSVSPISEFAAARDCYLKAVEAINVMVPAAPEASSTTTGAKADGKKLGVEQSYQLLAVKIAELDDRVLFAQQQKQRDTGSATGYKPTVIPQLVQRATKTASGQGKETVATTAQTTFLTARSTVQWMVPPTAGKGGKVADAADLEIPVYNIKVKENLREAAAVGATEAMQAVLETVNASEKGASSTSDKFSATSINTSHIINVGQQIRVVDLFDKTIGLLNDALTHALAERRSVQGEARTRQAQRLALFLEFHINRLSAERTFFVVECLARRFWFHVQQNRSKKTPKANHPSNTPIAADTSATKANKGIKAHKVPTASPIELVRLYTTAQDTLTKAYHTPGVEGSDSVLANTVEAQIELCKAGRLLYAGAAWQIVENAANALQALQAAKKQVEAVAKFPADGLTAALSAEFLSARATTSIVLVGIELNLAPYRAAQAKAKDQGQLSTAETQYLIDHLDEGISFAVTVEKKAASPKSATNTAAKPDSQPKKPTGPQFTTTANLVKLPPSYIPIGSKPAFVDIAATFIDFGDFARAKQKPASVAAAATGKKATDAKQHTKAEPKADMDAPQQEKKGWLGGWGWGKK